MPDVKIDLEHLERILSRYDQAGPRYTSYPTAPVWNEGFGPGALREALERRAPEAPLSLYVHVPFCRSLCHFCACNRVVTRDAALPARYLDAVERELETVASGLAAGVRVTQLHWGGGTPTHLLPDQIHRLHDAISGNFDLEADAEQSIEVDPRVTTAEQIAVLRRLGFRRVSLGVQDTDPRVQAAIHRIQPLETTAALVAEARGAGFESVGFDLIYGLPYQTVDGFARTLDGVLDLLPDRVALYAYAHVTWVAKQQRGFERKDLPDPPTRLRILTTAIRRFLEAGYVAVGMDHFARPDDALAQALREGTLRRNFMGYTTQSGVDFVGFGPSAISGLTDAYAQSHRELAAWEEAALAGSLATMRGHLLSEDDRARRFVIERLMCHGELTSRDLEADFGSRLEERFPAELARLAPLEEDGLVEIADGAVRVTPIGRLLLRNVAMAFDAYLPSQREGGSPLFSRTV